MKIRTIRTISGPNVYHAKPVMVMTLDLEILKDFSSDMIVGFTTRLLQLLPGLKEHRCSPGYRGGFVERLERGTYFAHIVEHICLELSGYAGIDVGYGKSVYAGSQGVYKIIVRYRAEKAMKFLLASAVEIAQNLFDGHPIDLQRMIDTAKELVQDEQLGPSTQAMVNAAIRKNIPWQRINHRNLIQFGHGRNRKLIQATTTSSTSDIAVDIAQDKFLTKKMLKEAGIVVPVGKVVHTVEEAIETLSQYDTPLVVKPDDGHQGQGTTLDVTTPDEMRIAFDFAQQYSNTVLIEEWLEGDDHRIVVVGNKMVAASKRVPAHVIGDGERTIFQLIENENKNPLRGEGHSKPLTKIEIDRPMQEYLQKQNFTLDYVPTKDQFIPLRQTANLSTGGFAYDVTDLVHPDIQFMCIRAARIVGLDICGVDLMAQDISKAPCEQKLGIIEVNAGPGIRMHHFPNQGRPRDVGGAILDHMYPNAEDARIPIIAITGTNGKTTVTRMIAENIIVTGVNVGVTTSEGVYINHYKVEQGDTTGAASARMILCDPGVDVAVLETARGGIVKRGLGFDWCDIGVITNVQPDHIGQDGIETLHDILKIKSLIAERVRPGGTLILNADDVNLVDLSKNLSNEAQHTVFFTTQEPGLVILQHLAAGKCAYYIEDNMVIEARGNHKHVIMDIREVPLTYGGTAQFQISNVLASIAACRAYGMHSKTLNEALKSFLPGKNNKGRANLYKVKNGYFIIDYGHNPRAIQSIAEMVRQWNVPIFTGVIAAPGDRSDDMIRMSGKIAAESFDRIIVREDVDLRGREKGDTAKLLCEIIQKENKSIECQILLSSEQAFEQAVHGLKDGEVVAFFYDDLEEIRTLLKKYDATEVTRPVVAMTIPPIYASSPERPLVG